MDRQGSGVGAGRTPEFRSTVYFMFAIALLFLVVGTTFQVLLGEVGLLLTQWVLLLGGTVYFVVTGRYDLRATLALRRPLPQECLAAFLIIAGGLPLAWFLAWVQSFFLPVPVELLEAIRDFLITDDPLRILWLLFVVAVTPAVCEEVLFRGVFLSGSRNRFSSVGALALNAAVFGAFHLAPQTAFRFLPTAWLGLLLALVVWRTGSIWLAVGMHFLNNATVLLLTVAPGFRDQFAEVERDPPLALFPFAAVTLLLGLYLLWNSKPRRGYVEEQDSQSPWPRT